MKEDPKSQEQREAGSAGSPEQREAGEESPAEGSGATDDEGGAERAGLGRSEAEDKISK